MANCLYCKHERREHEGDGPCEWSGGYAFCDCLKFVGADGHDAEIAALRAEVANLKQQHQEWDERNIGIIGRLRAEVERLKRDHLARALANEEIIRLRRERDEALKVWRCFHCGFETADPAVAQAHFGERDDASEFTPTCTWWASMSAEEKVQEFQDTLQQLNAERDESGMLQSKIDGLEHRLLEFEQVVDARFPGCRSINDVFHRYDTMEGLKLVAEENVRLLGEQLEFDRTAVADAITKARKALNSRYWLTEGRGSYEWDDDRYRDEFGAAWHEIKAAVESLSHVAANWAGCPKKAEDVAAARRDLKAELDRLRDVVKYAAEQVMGDSADHYRGCQACADALKGGD